MSLERDVLEPRCRAAQPHLERVVVTILADYEREQWLHVRRVERLRANYVLAVRYASNNAARLREWSGAGSEKEADDDVRDLRE